MENDEDQEIYDRIQAQLDRLKETSARDFDEAIEFQADIRARIQMIDADQQRMADILKGMKNEL